MVPIRRCRCGRQPGRPSIVGRDHAVNGPLFRATPTRQPRPRFHRFCPFRIGRPPRGPASPCFDRLAPRRTAPSLAGLAVIRAACGARARSFRGEVLKKSNNQSFPALGASGRMHPCAFAQDADMAICDSLALAAQKRLTICFFEQFRPEKRSGRRAGRGGTGARGVARGGRRARKGWGTARKGAGRPGGRRSQSSSQISTDIRVLFVTCRVDREQATP